MEMKKESKLLRTAKHLTSAREFTVFVLVLLAIVIMTATNPFFLKTANLQSVLLGLAADGILAVAITFACIAGVFDFSIGAVMGFSGMLLAVFSQTGMNIWLCAILTLVVCAGIGLINGFLIGKIRLNALIASLAMQKVIHGIVYVISSGLPVKVLTTPAFKNLSQYKFLGLQMFIWIYFLIAIVAEILLRHTTTLRKLFYTGSNEKAAILSGINTIKVKVSVYVTTASLAAVTGILYATRFGTATCDAGIGTEMTVLSAAVIGGASIKGGEGSILGTFLGIILMNLLSNALVIYKLDVFWQTLCEGLILLVAIIIDYLIHVNREKRCLKSTH